MHIHLISIRASVRYSLLLTFAADCLFSGQSRRSPVMPELIDPLLAPHPPSPWRHSGSFSFFLQHILERPFRSVSAVGVLRSVAPSPHTQGVGVIDETPLPLSGTPKTNES